jgi:hypothetical protein
VKAGQWSVQLLNRMFDLTASSLLLLLLLMLLLLLQL